MRKGTTMANLIYEWLSVQRMVVRANSYENYCQVAEKHVIPYFNSLKVLVQNLRPVHIQRYYSFKSGQGIAASTMEKHRTVIHSSLNYAIKMLGIIKVNPAVGVTMPRKEKRIPRFYTETMLVKLFAEIKGQSIEPAVRLCATYGFRRSEALGLCWSAINFERRTITIQHTVVRCGSKVISGNITKTGSSYRTLPLTADMECYLNQLYERQAAMKSKFGEKYVDNEYICKWDDGRPLKPDYVSNRFRKFIKNRGLPQIRFHDLRHSSASLLINNGFTLKEVQEWLGHASIKSTEVYSHLLYKSKENMAIKINQLLHIEEKPLFDAV